MKVYEEGVLEGRREGSEGSGGNEEEEVNGRDRVGRERKRKVREWEVSRWRKRSLRNRG